MHRGDIHFERGVDLHRLAVDADRDASCLARALHFRLLVRKQRVQLVGDHRVYVLDHDCASELDAQLQLLEEATGLHVKNLDISQLLAQPLVRLSLRVYQNRLKLSTLEDDSVLNRVAVIG